MDAVVGMVLQDIAFAAITATSLATIVMNNFSIIYLFNQAKSTGEYYKIQRKISIKLCEIDNHLLVARKKMAKVPGPEWAPITGPI